jgi:hypothetical protein
VMVYESAHAYVLSPEMTLTAVPQLQANAPT